NGLTTASPLRSVISSCAIKRPADPKGTTMSWGLALRNGFFLGAVAFALAVVVPTTVLAQQVRPERTIEEIKVEAISRAENGQYPCIGQNPDDLREAFASIKTRDRDEWAAAFIAVGDK